MTLPLITFSLKPPKADEAITTPSSRFTGPCVGVHGEAAPSQHRQQLINGCFTARLFDRSAFSTPPGCGVPRGALADFMSGRRLIAGFFICSWINAGKSWGGDTPAPAPPPILGHPTPEVMTVRRSSWIDVPVSDA